MGRNEYQSVRGIFSSDETILYLHFGGDYFCIYLKRVHFTWYKLYRNTSVMGWIVSPQNSYIEILIPGISEYDLLGDRVFAKAVKLKWGH